MQKLARTISGLHAIELLLDRGLFQEQGMIQRALDEIGEDTIFLSLGVIDGQTQRHKDYLEYFYAEEFADPSDIMGSHTSRPMVRREKIRAYIHRRLDQDASRANVVFKIVNKAYSGFVHAASPHIMDMVYGESSPHFDLSGASRRLWGEGHANDALNYFLRALFSMAFAAKAFGDEELFGAMVAESDKLLAIMAGRQ